MENLPKVNISTVFYGPGVSRKTSYAKHRICDREKWISKWKIRRGKDMEHWKLIFFTFFVRWRKKRKTEQQQRITHSGPNLNSTHTHLKRIRWRTDHIRPRNGFGIDGKSFKTYGLRVSASIRRFSSNANKRFRIMLVGSSTFISVEQEKKPRYSVRVRLFVCICGLHVFLY